MAFENVHRDRITGSLAMFDRMIFKGPLNASQADGPRCFLWSQGVALKDFTAYAKATTERIANNARKLVTDAGRPVISFDHVKTRNRTQHKDELAKSIAERDGITEGIICLISAVETCFSFQVRKRHDSGKLELFRRERKCLHHYLYLIDDEFGFMHIRMQRWIPYECQIYINGREWLARQLHQRGRGLCPLRHLAARRRQPRDRRRAVRPLRSQGVAAGAERLRQTPQSDPARHPRRQLRRLLLGARPGRDRHRHHVQDSASVAGGLGLIWSATPR